MRSSPGSVSKFQAKGQIERTARLEKFGPARFAEKSGGVGGLLCRQRTPFVIAYVLPIRNPACPHRRVDGVAAACGRLTKVESSRPGAAQRPLSPIGVALPRAAVDRKSTRLNSSHQIISYAVFCLKKKKNNASNERT